MSSKLQAFLLQSVLGQFQCLFQSQLSIQYDPVLPHYISSILSFPSDHTAAAYVFFLVFPSLYPSPVFPSITWFRRQVLRKMWPIQLPFLLVTLCRTFPFHWHFLNLLSFSHDRSNCCPPFFSNNTLKLSSCFWSTFRSSQVSAPYKIVLLTQHISCILLKFQFNLMVKIVVFWLNAAFAMTILDLISAVHLHHCYHFRP